MFWACFFGPVFLGLTTYELDQLLLLQLQRISCFFMQDESLDSDLKSDRDKYVFGRPYCHRRLEEIRLSLEDECRSNGIDLE